MRNRRSSQKRHHNKKLIDLRGVTRVTNRRRTFLALRNLTLPAQHGEMIASSENPDGQIYLVMF